MKNQAYRMALLYDFYGDMLTDRQKEFYDLYYNEDLSLAEIAENYGITRQGVRDVIVRAEAILTELEDKTGLIRRFEQMRGHLQDGHHPPLPQNAGAVRPDGDGGGRHRPTQRGPLAGRRAGVPVRTAQGRSGPVETGVTHGI